MHSILKVKNYLETFTTSFPVVNMKNIDELMTLYTDSISDLTDLYQMNVQEHCNKFHGISTSSLTDIKLFKSLNNDILEYNQLISSLMDPFLKYLKIRHDLNNSIILSILFPDIWFDSFSTHLKQFIPGAKRAPDKIIVDLENQLIFVTEFTYSKSEFKGFLNKGYSIITSKYLTEILNIKLIGDNFKLVYLPIIASDRWHETSRVGTDLVPSECKPLHDYIKLMESLGYNYPSRKEFSLSQNNDKLKKCLMINELISKSFYPYGKLLNVCITSMRIVQSLKLSVPPVVEYNINLVNHLMYNIPNTNPDINKLRLTHYIFGQNDLSNLLKRGEMIEGFLDLRSNISSLDELEIDSILASSELIQRTFRSLSSLSRDGMLNHHSINNLLVDPYKYVKDEIKGPPDSLKKLIDSRLTLRKLESHLLNIDLIGMSDFDIQKSCEQFLNNEIRLIDLNFSSRFELTNEDCQKFKDSVQSITYEEFLKIIYELSEETLDHFFESFLTLKYSEYIERMNVEDATSKIDDLRSLGIRGMVPQINDIIVLLILILNSSNLVMIRKEHIVKLTNRLMTISVKSIPLGMILKLLISYCDQTGLKSNMPFAFDVVRTFNKDFNPKPRMNQNYIYQFITYKYKFFTQRMIDSSFNSSLEAMNSIIIKRFGINSESTELYNSYWKKVHLYTNELSLTLDEIYNYSLDDRVKFLKIYSDSMLFNKLNELYFEVLPSRFSSDLNIEELVMDKKQLEQLRDKFRDYYPEFCAINDEYSNQLSSLAYDSFDMVHPTKLLERRMPLPLKKFLLSLNTKQSLSIICSHPILIKDILKLLTDKPVNYSEKILNYIKDYYNLCQDYLNLNEKSMNLDQVDIIREKLDMMSEEIDAIENLIVNLKAAADRRDKKRRDEEAIKLMVEQKRLAELKEQEEERLRIEEEKLRREREIQEEKAEERRKKDMEIMMIRQNELDKMEMDVMKLDWDDPESIIKSYADRNQKLVNQKFRNLEKQKRRIDRQLEKRERTLRKIEKNQEKLIESAKRVNLDTSKLQIAERNTFKFQKKPKVKMTVAEKLKPLSPKEEKVTETTSISNTIMHLETEPSNEPSSQVKDNDNISSDQFDIEICKLNETVSINEIVVDSWEEIIDDESGQLIEHENQNDSKYLIIVDENNLIDELLNNRSIHNLFDNLIYITSSRLSVNNLMESGSLNKLIVYVADGIVDLDCYNKDSNKMLFFQCGTDKVINFNNITEVFSIDEISSVRNDCKLNTIKISSENLQLPMNISNELLIHLTYQSKGSWTVSNSSIDYIIKYPKLLMESGYSSSDYYSVLKESDWLDNNYVNLSESLEEAPCFRDSESNKYEFEKHISPDIPNYKSIKNYCADVVRKLVSTDEVVKSMKVTISRLNKFNIEEEIKMEEMRFTSGKIVKHNKVGGLLWVKISDIKKKSFGNKFFKGDSSEFEIMKSLKEANNGVSVNTFDKLEISEDLNYVIDQQRRLLDTKRVIHKEKKLNRGRFLDSDQTLNSNHIETVKFCPFDIKELNKVGDKLEELSRVNTISFNTDLFFTRFRNPMNKVQNISLENYRSKLKEFINDSIYNCFIYSELISMMIFDIIKSKDYKKVREGKLIYLNNGNLSNIFINYIHTGRKLNSNTQMSYFFVIPGNECSDEFKDYNGIKYTKVMTHNLSQLTYKSNLFYSVMIFIISFFDNPSFSITGLRQMFLIMFYSNFMYDGLKLKNILSFSKYSNVISMSKYNKFENLVKKYLVSGPFKSYLQQYISLRYYDDFIFNISRKHLESPDDCDYIVRHFAIGNLEIRDYIRINTLYNMTYRDSTRFEHDNVLFVRGILENNNKLNSSRYLRDNFVCIDKEVDKSSKLIHLPSLEFSVILFQRECFQSGVNYSFDLFNKYISKEIELQFGDNFINNRKSMSDDNEFLKKETVINFWKTIDIGDEMFSPCKFYNDIINDDQTCEAVLGKKGQAETDREVYILNLKAKVMASYVQIVFKFLNKRMKGEMVVQSQIKKLKELNGVSNLVMTKSKGEEIFMYNGDMAKWSGQDVFYKFILLTDLLLKYNFISRSIWVTLKHCLKSMMNLKVYILKSVNINSFRSMGLKFDNIKKLYYINIIHSWPQGIFHNISSFVHGLEQRYRKFFLKLSFKPIQLSHSDDKNEIYKLTESDINNKIQEKIVTYNTLIPLLFSLLTSSTKDSYSELISEMVGLQNIRGSLFDNPNKIIHSIFNTFSLGCFKDAYSMCLSRLVDFFRKSSCISSFYQMEELVFVYLSRRFKLNEDSWMLPISCGGRLKADILSLEQFGTVSDDLASYRISKDMFFKSKCIIINWNEFRRTSNRMREFLDELNKLSDVKLEGEMYYNIQNKSLTTVRSMIKESLMNIKRKILSRKDDLSSIKFFLFKRKVKGLVTKVKKVIKSEFFKVYSKELNIDVSKSDLTSDTINKFVRENFESNSRDKSTIYDNNKLVYEKLDLVDDYVSVADVKLNFEQYLTIISKMSLNETNVLFERDSRESIESSIPKFIRDRILLNMSLDVSENPDTVKTKHEFRIRFFKRSQNNSVMNLTDYRYMMMMDIKLLISKYKLSSLKLLIEKITSPFFQKLDESNDKSYKYKTKSLGNYELIFTDRTSINDNIIRDFNNNRIYVFGQRGWASRDPIQAPESKGVGESIKKEIDNTNYSASTLLNISSKVEYNFYTLAMSVFRRENKDYVSVKGHLAECYKLVKGRSDIFLSRDELKFYNLITGSNSIEFNNHDPDQVVDSYEVIPVRNECLIYLLKNKSSTCFCVLIKRYNKVYYSMKYEIEKFRSIYTGNHRIIYVNLDKLNENIIKECNKLLIMYGIIFDTNIGLFRAVDVVHEDHNIDFDFDKGRLRLTVMGQELNFDKVMTKYRDFHDILCYSCSNFNQLFKFNRINNSLTIGLENDRSATEVKTDIEFHINALGKFFDCFKSMIGSNKQNLWTLLRMNKVKRDVVSSIFSKIRKLIVRSGKYNDSEIKNQKYIWIERLRDVMLINRKKKRLIESIGDDLDEVHSTMESSMVEFDYDDLPDSEKLKMLIDGLDIDVIDLLSSFEGEVLYTVIMDGISKKTVKQINSSDMNDYRFSPQHISQSVNNITLKNVKSEIDSIFVSVVLITMFKPITLFDDVVKEKSTLRFIASLNLYMFWFLKNRIQEVGSSQLYYQLLNAEMVVKRLFSDDFNKLDYESIMLYYSGSKNRIGGDDVIDLDLMSMKGINGVLDDILELGAPVMINEFLKNSKVEQGSSTNKVIDNNTRRSYINLHKDKILNPKKNMFVNIISKYTDLNLKLFRYPYNQ